MAEDLVSQVFLDVWRTARQFEGRSQVSTWLLSIARFKALTALRQRRHEDIDQEDVLEIADEADTPEASLDRSNTSAILRACVAKLSPAHREIINLVYYHEKSVEEAGADHRHSPEHGEDPDVLCPQATGRSAQGSRRRQPGGLIQTTAHETNETIDDIRRKNSLSTKMTSR